MHVTDIDPDQWSYEEVEGVISNKDEPTMLCFTFRAYLLGCLLGSIRSFSDTYFAYRTRQFILEPVLFSLMAYPLGKLLAFILPQHKWTRWNITLNPGSFTIKEHALIILMMASSYPALSLQQLDLQRLFFTGKTAHPVAAIGYIVSTQLLGFGLAGKSNFVGEYACYVGILLHQSISWFSEKKDVKRKETK